LGIQVVVVFNPGTAQFATASEEVNEAVEVGNPDCSTMDELSGAGKAATAVVDDAQEMGLRAGDKVRFARGTARNKRWCEIERRAIEWVPRASS
jgi:hypothetical protein